MSYKFTAKQIKPSEITPKSVYLNRRRLVASMLSLPAALSLPAVATAATTAAVTALPSESNPMHTLTKRGYEELTPKKKALAYNNFYELGSGKEDPADNADWYEPSPWRLEVSGEVHNPRVFDVDDLQRIAPLEERVYRMRCVEAWSMVIPWIGYSFSHLIRAVEPTGNAKYVQFLTFDPRDLFPGKDERALPWPYSEGLRLDEAMNPLALFTFGMYGETLGTPNGAPARMIIPWKYGFKSGKALVKIIFTEKEPPTTWNLAGPSEYGFYSNVNPTVSHPRWSQSSERAISDSFLPTRRETEMFNGYGDEVASLYAGMDLQSNF